MARIAVQDPSLKPEVWTWYGIGVLWLLLRFFVRIRTLGLLHLQLDDFFAFWVLVTWTIIVVGIHLTTEVGTNVDYTEAEIDTFSDEDIEQVEWASKLFLLTFYA
ncbi:hypothetical protein N0V82_002549 [Gnomoniopsis sp. IMI 355080]|nr:hypothetical protein N0V82_002549 [Gnomoniopsis sp. IMI 355080]